MAVTSFIPEVWAAELLAEFDRRHVYAQPGVVNRDYEGDVAEYGNTVNINSVADPTIAPYVPNTTSITPEELTTTQQQLLIDQRNYFAFLVDDVDARQVRDDGNLFDEAARRAAWGLADAADLYVASLYTTITNDLGSVALTTPDLAGQLLIDMKVALDEADVPMDGRYAIMPAWVHGLLLDNDRFVAADRYGSTTPILNGEIGRAYGFSILTSNNAPQPVADTSWVVQGGTADGSSYVEQINQTMAYQPEDSFSDALKGLHVFGAKVTRPDKLVRATVTKA